MLNLLLTLQEKLDLNEINIKTYQLFVETHLIFQCLKTGFIEIWLYSKKDKIQIEGLLFISFS